MKKTPIVLVLAGILAGAASPAFAACAKGHGYRAAAPAKARTVASVKPAKPAQTLKAPDAAQPAPNKEAASAGNTTSAQQTAAAPTGSATSATF